MAMTAVQQFLYRRMLMAAGRALAVLAIGWGIALALDSTLLAYVTLAGAYFAYASGMRTSVLVLWLRRFHSRERLPVRGMLAGRSGGLFDVVTLQDSTFTVSLVSAMNRWGHFGFLLFIAWGMVLLVASVLASLVLGDYFGQVSEQWVSIGVVAGIACLVLSLLPAKWLLTRFAALHLRTGEDLVRITRHAQQVRSGKRISTGVVVFRTDDAIWRGAVECALPLVDAVLVDVTAPSENIAWELERALAIQPKKVVLLIGRTSPSVDSDRHVLRTLLGREPTNEEAGAVVVIDYLSSACAGRWWFPSKHDCDVVSRVVECLYLRAANGLPRSPIPDRRQHDPSG